MPGSKPHHPIVQRALKEGHVTDLGQLTDEEKKALKAAVKNGVLKKGKGGGFPVRKTVYVPPAFDIKGHHAAELAHLDHAAQFKAGRWLAPTARAIPEGDPRLKLGGITMGGKVPRSAARVLSKYLMASS
jgi:hypothetical protein